MIKKKLLRRALPVLLSVAMVCQSAPVMSMAAETWTVAGSPASVFGTAWDPANTANVMADQGDGNYKWEKRNASIFILAFSL